MIENSTIQGRMAVVTGASRGIGAAIAGALAKAGWTVALLGRDGDALEAVRQRILAAGGSAIALKCDVTGRAWVDEAVSQIRRLCGNPAALINNAGAGGPFHRTNDVTDAEWDLAFATNVRSAFWFSRAFLPGMRDAGFGRIVNISSVYGLSGGAESSVYAATKHALVGYTKSIACEWGKFGVTCNAICPGFVATPMLHTSGIDQQISSWPGPSGRAGMPEEVAALAAFLVRDEAAFINGATLAIDGGLSAGMESVRIMTRR